MNRLTGRNEKGDLLLCGEYVYGNNQDVYNGISLLEEYENTELEPEQIDELNKMLLNDQIRHGRALDKLLEYQKLEEQGLLIKLPCKIGRDLYIVSNRVDGKGHVRRLTLTHNNLGNVLKRLDDDIFKTREEAEKALEAPNGE